MYLSGLVELGRDDRVGHALGLEVPVELLALLIEEIAQPLQEQHAEDVFLVLRGIHVAAQVVAGAEQEAGELAEGELGHYQEKLIWVNHSRLYGTPAAYRKTELSSNREIGKPVHARRI